MEPVVLGHVALGDGEVARHPGLRREEIIVGGVVASGPLRVGQAIADREQFALRIIEEREVHLGRQPVRPSRELLQSGRHGRRVGVLPGRSVQRAGGVQEVVERAVASGFLAEGLDLPSQALEGFEDPGLLLRRRDRGREHGVEPVHFPGEPGGELPRRALERDDVLADLAEELDGIADPRLDPRPGSRRDGALAKPLGENHEARGEVSAVHGGDVAGMERRQALGLVPVQEVSLEPLDALEGRQRAVDAVRQLRRPQVAEVVRRQGGEQSEPDVGGGRPVGHAHVAQLLEVVRRQGVVGGPRERVEEVPRPPRHAAQERDVLGAEPDAAGGDGPAEPEGDERREEPEGQERRRRGERGRPDAPRDEGERRGEERAAAELDQELDHGPPPVEALRPGRDGRGGLPFEEPLLRDRQPDQRHRDRVDHPRRLVHQEGGRHEELRERGAQLLPPGLEPEAERLGGQRQGEQAQQRRQEREREDRQGAQRPPPGRPGEGRPAGGEQEHHHGGDEAPAQVVEDLPAADDREPVPFHAPAGRHPGEQPEQDLPVAPHPAVLPAHVGDHARRIVVDDLDVADQRGPRVKAFEEVVGQQRVLRDSVAEGGEEGIDVVEPLPRVDALAEEILVRVGHRGGVRVDAGVARVDAGEERSRRAGEGDAHPGLEDAVPLRDPALRQIEAGPVERVEDDPDQLLGSVAREPRVPVERDAEADLRKDRDVAHLGRVAGVAGAAEQPVELLDLSPLPLPPHPPVLLRVPQPRPMEQEESVIASLAQARVEGFDPLAGGVEQLGVPGGLGRRRVDEVAEDREVDVGIHVADRLHLEVLEKPLDVLRARQQRGDDDHRPAFGRDASGQVEPRQRLRADEPHHGPLDDRDGQVARREEGDQRGQELVPGSAHGKRRRQGAEQRQHPDRDEIEGGGMAPEERGGPLPERGLVGDVDLELRTALSQQMVADVARPFVVRIPLLGLDRAFDGPERDAHLGLPAGLGELLDDLTVAVPRGEVHPLVDARGVAVEDLLDLADALEVESPVQGRAEPQAGDRVPDGRQGGGLLLVLRADGVLGREIVEQEPIVHEPAELGGVGAVLAEVAEELHDVGGRGFGGKLREDAPLLPLVPRGEELVGGHAGGSRLEDVFGDPAEVLEEGDPEHAGPGPELADGERREGLVGDHEAGQPVEVEVAVAVADELEGHDVDAGRSFELARGQLGQLEVVGPRQVPEDLELLALDEVEVVKQPLRRRGDRAAEMDVLGDGPVGLAEHAAGLVETGAEPPRSGPGPAGEREAAGEGAGPDFERLSAQKGSAMGALRGRKFRWPADPAESQAAPLMTASGRTAAKKPAPDRGVERGAEVPGTSSGPNGGPSRTSLLRGERSGPSGARDPVRLQTLRSARNLLQASAPGGSGIAA
jgi:hypothetical protein